MQPLLRILCIACAAFPLIVQADELAYLKELAAKNEMKYLGTTLDNAAYIFSGKKNTLDVLIPTEVFDDREAFLCFNAAFESAEATWDLKNQIDEKAFKAAMDSKEQRLKADPNPR
jgi:hypothetical protein